MVFLPLLLLLLLVLLLLMLLVMLRQPFSVQMHRDATLTPMYIFFQLRLRT